MDIVILAGGLGTRLAEETEIRPKPMVEIGGRPILWHILKHFAHYGQRDFYVALGYKGEVIKQYFRTYHALAGSMTVKVASGEVVHDGDDVEDWTVRLIETGQSSNTGGRIRRMRRHLSGGTFLVTYGDGVSDVDVDRLIRFHKAEGRIATVTAVRPPARFGGLLFDEAEPALVSSFTEKPQAGEGWINGGYICCEPAIFDYLPTDDTSLEGETLTRLAAEGQLAAYRHDGFWQCMDTLRDKQRLEQFWQTGTAPWKVWA